MSSTRIQTHLEVEFKYRVPENFSIEPLLTGDLACESGSIRTMSATYFDTTTATLLRWGITMRHRMGGSDDGWHLKIPVFDSGITGGASVRSELHVDGEAGDPPAQFIAVIGALLRDSEVVPLARVNTIRTPFQISHGGEKLLEVVSDHVQVYRGENLVDSFHEIEVELLQDSGLRVAKKLISLLEASGATPSSVSKASAGFGAVASAQPDVPKLPRPKKSALPYDLIRWALTQQVRAVIRTEVQSHLDHSPAFLIRELNFTSQILSALKMYLESTEMLPLCEEINWLVAELSSPEQIHIDHARATAALDTIHDPLDRHEALLAIEAYFDRRAISAQSSAIAAQRSDRYFYFFNDLMDFANVPPVTDLSFIPQKIWKNVDPVDLPTVALIFRRVFPKKSQKILAHSSILNQSDNQAEMREILRRIAMDPHTTAAGAYALGTAVGQMSTAALIAGGEYRE